MVRNRFSMALICCLATAIRAPGVLAFGAVRGSSSGAFRSKTARTVSALTNRRIEPVVRRPLEPATRLFATVVSKANKTKKKKKKKLVPITLLSGFLGSGKTSALKHLLENTDGVRIGVIVNDVASVNIDAKLVAATNQGTIELQNGCACCSLADELLVSVESLLKQKKGSLDAVVVELSGVADPVAVKSNWKTAKSNNHPATRMADVKRIVTLVDACTFGTDWMTWDQAIERGGWVEDGDDCSGQRHVPELLAEQVEAANLILVNKVDLAGSEQVEVASSVAQAINEKADLFAVEFGKVSPKDVLGMEEPVKSESHSHDHDHDCADPDCTDASHSHSHSHESSHTHDSSCTDPDCTDSSHDHSHSHDHACDDPNCTDESHTHDHSHSSTAADQLGIVSFVYKSTKPFNPPRIMALLNQWPVPIKEDLDLELIKQAQEDGYAIQGESQSSPFLGVLRSKGFCWFAPTKWTGPNDDVWRHDTAMYWSHAGKHFGISSAGKWWGTISKEQMKRYFVDNMSEYERIIKEDFASEEWGDRRQEVVFIGANLDEKAIRSALDDCLLTDEEMDVYGLMLRNYMDSTYTTQASAPSLFDVGGTDHLDV